MEKQWWHNKVAYQIYPKSFYDHNGDGIGDIPGIIEKLDHLAYLGVDILWISPVYQSPLADQGYDISDYYAIDPRFGTMEDMDRLIAEAKKRQMYILMDLVINHCSDEHVWFQKAMADPEGEYGNFFYLADQKDGRPCNWRSYFGGSVWEPLPGTDKQYLHMFHKKQPDLNWEEPRVRQEIYKMINWWLEKGVAGFRLDAIINIKKALPMKDYPADRPDGLADPGVMLAHAEGIGAFLKEMKEETFQKYHAFTVGEVFNEKPEELAAFIGEDGYFSSMFDFRETAIGSSPKGWYDNRPVTGEGYKAACFESQERSADIGFYSNIIENHDEPRGVSRYLPKDQVCEASKKMLAGSYFMLRGIPFIYQGQEIGMENTDIPSIDQVDDISSRAEYEAALQAGLSEERAMEAVRGYSRDNARTPMQWNGERHGGFTKGTPWIKAAPSYRLINVEEQRGRKDSVLEFYRSLIALRKDPKYEDSLIYGACIPYLREQKGLMAYLRKGEIHTLLVMGNYQGAPQKVELSGTYEKVLINNMDRLDEEEDGKICLMGWQYVILEMRS